MKLSLCSYSRGQVPVSHFSRFRATSATCLASSRSCYVGHFSSPDRAFWRYPSSRLLHLTEAAGDARKPARTDLGPPLPRSTGPRATQASLGSPTLSPDPDAPTTSPDM